MIRPVLMDEHEGLYIRFDDIRRKLGDYEKRVEELEKKEDKVYALFPCLLGSSFRGYAYAIYTQEEDNVEDKTVYPYYPRYFISDYNSLALYNETTKDYIKHDDTLHYWQDGVTQSYPFYYYDIPETDFYGINYDPTGSDAKNYKKIDYHDNLLAIVYCNREPNLLLAGLCDCQPDEYTYYSGLTSERNYLDTVINLGAKNSYELPIKGGEFEFVASSTNTVSEFGPCFFTADGKMISRRRYAIHPTTGERVECYAPVETTMPYILEKFDSGYSFFTYRPCVSWSWTWTYHGTEYNPTAVDTIYTNEYDYTGILGLVDIPKLYALNPDFKNYMEHRLEIDTNITRAKARIAAGGEINRSGVHIEKLTGTSIYTNYSEMMDSISQWENWIKKKTEDEFFNAGWRIRSKFIPNGAYTSERKFGGELYNVNCTYSEIETEKGFVKLGMSYSNTNEEKLKYRIKRVPEFDRTIVCSGITGLDEYKDSILYEGYGNLPITEAMKPYFQKVDKLIPIEPIKVFED